MEVIEGNLKGEVICLKLLLGRVILSLIKLYMNFNLALPTTENMPAPSALLYKSSLTLLLVLTSAFSSTSRGNFLSPFHGFAASRSRLRQRRCIFSFLTLCFPFTWNKTQVLPLISTVWDFYCPPSRGPEDF